MNRAMVAALSGFALLAASSCVTEVCGCSPSSASAILTGSVVDGAGAPAPSAQVHASSEQFEGCWSLGVKLGVVSAAQDGSFRMDVTVPTLEDSVCVLVFADPPPGSDAFGPSDTTMLVMDFSHELTPDSADVELALSEK